MDVRGGGCRARGRRSAGCPGARLRIDIHHEVFEPGARCYRPGRRATPLRALAAADDQVELLEHDYFSDDELWDVPERDSTCRCCRTASARTPAGWRPASISGTAVVAPSCGFYAEQRPCLIYRHDETGLDAGSLADAVRGRVRARPAHRARARRTGARAAPCAGAAHAVDLRAGAADEGRDRSPRRGFPIAEPFAGGLEAHVWGLADRLRRRGHEVTLFAGPGSDPRLGVELLDLRRPRLSAAARADVSMTRAGVGRRAPRLPAADAPARARRRRTTSTSSTTTACTTCRSRWPRRCRSRSCARCTRRRRRGWSRRSRSGDDCPRHVRRRQRAHGRGVVAPAPDARVIHNGVDVDRWRPGPGRRPAGVVRADRAGEGDAPRHRRRGARRAAAAAAGPDRGPRRTSSARSGRGSRWRRSSTRAISPTRSSCGSWVSASVALVTPCWDEPYGLVVAEALACGTPVCALRARRAAGAARPADCGRLVAPGRRRSAGGGDRAAAELSRAAAASTRCATCSLDAMVDALRRALRRAGRCAVA